MRTLLMDCPFEVEGADNHSFKSVVSVFDYDLIFWYPAESANRYTIPMYQSFYRGRPSLSEDVSVGLKEDIGRRRKEFAEFVQLGRTLIIVACPPQIFWADTGKRETSGTGRNQKVTRLLSEVDVLSALPYPYSATEGGGLEIDLVNPIAAALWRETKGHWIYRCTLDDFPGEPVFQVSGAGKVVGSLLIEESGGVVLTIPDPYIPKRPNQETDDDTDEDIAEDGGTDEDQATDQDDPFMVPKAVLRFAEGISVQEDEPAPEWATALLFDTEVNRAKEMVKLETAMAELAEKLAVLQGEAAEDAQWKRLITSQGENLERQVRLAFEFLGFEVLEARPGRGDLRLNYDDTRLVVEVKGLSKSAAEKNAAQLEKWVAEELSDDTRAKGVLVINSWRERRPGERPASFPDQMVGYATARGHCLITGLQLLNMCQRAKGDDSLKEVYARLIVEHVGVVPGFDDLTEIFSVTPEVGERASGP